MAEILHALPAYAQRRVISCGDYENDVGLLRMADIGIAPEDASADAKAAADRIGPPCREPLVPWILREILSKYPHTKRALQLQCSFCMR